MDIENLFDLSHVLYIQNQKKGLESLPTPPCEHRVKPNLPNIVLALHYQTFVFH